MDAAVQIRPVVIETQSPSQTGELTETFREYRLRIFHFALQKVGNREHSLDRLVTEAKSLGANAVVCLRFMTSQVAPNMAELLAYGTAVVIEDE